ncbi:MAG: hypothetical protein K6T75_09420 [Acetobacteraceae bacterium]|nr:hypothetical protein [Acetobacteraceae bacterium]
MTEGAERRRVFPGANTARGFFSLHRYAAVPLASRVFILKGGPGVGKSTLIRALAEELERRGLEVEEHCCSSDNESLDGLYAPALGVAVLDGTPPHVLDPACPGAVEELVNLGECWDRDALYRDREAIVELTGEVARAFSHAYRRLACALSALECWEGLVEEALGSGRARLDALARELAGEVRSAGAAGAKDAGAGPEPAGGWERRLFATAITPGGMVGYLPRLAGGVSRRWVLLGPPGAGRLRLVRAAVEAAREAGLAMEAYHCSLDPDRVDHLVLPGAGVAVLSASPPHQYRPGPQDRVVDTAELLSPAVLRRVEPDLRSAEELYWSALSQAVEFLARAKAAHDRLEARYIPHMDFASVERKGRAILERALELAAGVPGAMSTAGA